LGKGTTVTIEGKNFVASLWKGRNRVDKWRHAERDNLTDLDCSVERIAQYKGIESVPKSSRYKIAFYIFSSIKDAAAHWVCSITHHRFLDEI
jgi:hypothetical protein